jgi:ABC-type Fe3+-citrate transport system substrate-binding protein
MKKFLVVLTICLAVLLVVACEDDSEEISESEQAVEYCDENGGVKTFTPSGYYQSAGVVCEDGSVYQWGN